MKKVDLSKDKPNQYAFPSRARAAQVGRAILKLMGGSKSGWKIRVWENLGWHVALRKGCITIYHRNRNGSSMYSTLMSLDHKSWVGELYFSPDEKEHITPWGAYQHQLKIAADHLKAVAKAIERST